MLIPCYGMTLADTSAVTAGKSKGSSGDQRDGRDLRDDAIQAICGINGINGMGTPHEEDRRPATTV